MKVRTLLVENLPVEEEDPAMGYFHAAGFEDD